MGLRGYETPALASKYVDKNIKIGAVINMNPELNPESYCTLRLPTLE